MCTYASGSFGPSRMYGGASGARLGATLNSCEIHLKWLPVTPEQRAAWVEAMNPVWEQFEGDVGEDNIAAAQSINESM